MSKIKTEEDFEAALLEVFETGIIDPANGLDEVTFADTFRNVSGIRARGIGYRYMRDEGNNPAAVVDSIQIPGADAGAC